MTEMEFKEHMQPINHQIFGYGVDSWNRMEKFIEISQGLTDVQYWAGLKMAFTSSDNTYYLREEIKILFLSARPMEQYIMDSDERLLLESLPETVIVYRGMSLEEYESEEYGISWSLERSVAEFFAYTYIRNLDTKGIPKVVVRAEVERHMISALWNDRKEEEVILNPSCLAMLDTDLVCANRKDAIMLR